MSACNQNCAQGRDCQCACYDAEAQAQWNRFYARRPSITMKDELELTLQQEIAHQAMRTAALVGAALVVGLVMGAVFQLAVI